MTAMADLLTVNEFTFCVKHGKEICPDCHYDFKPMNNYAILNELDGEIVENLSDDRTFGFNIYDIDPEIQPARDNGKEPCYKCSKHSVVDCSICFNWVELVTAKIREELKEEKWLKKRQKYLEKCD